MCGITGIVSLDGAKPVNEITLRRMTDALIHRGPDGDGFHLEAGAGLGHRRLSIIDLSGGDQPIYNEDRSKVIVFNGEIYNYKELQQEVIARGHSLKTNSDTEVIVHLYEEFGRGVLDHLNGMFGFALWDGEKKSLLLARDRLGEKPLYYAEVNGQLVFASELKSILQVPGIGTAISTNAVDDYLALGYVPAPNTIFENIYKLPAAHCLELKDGRYTVEQYWNVDSESVDMPTDDEERIDALRALLLDSVRIRLRSDVPVGAFLSGGIDSSLIVALAATASPNQLKTFTIGFPGANQDESADAEELATLFATEHCSIPLAEFDLTLLPALVDQFDEPFADPSSLPTYFVTREASRHVKVCLSGDGGDELFGGYKRYRYEPLERLLGKIPAQIRSTAFGSLARLAPQSMPGRGFVERMAVDGAQRLQRKVGIFSQNERAILWREDHKTALQTDSWFLERFDPGDSRSEMKRRMVMDRNTYLPEDVLTKVDRDSMANSIEVRVPLLDHRIVAFANHLPADLTFGAGEGKVALRRLLGTLVPQHILDRPKKGFGIPLRQWVKDGKLDEHLNLLTETDSVVKQYLRADVVDRYVKQGKAEGRDVTNRVWALMWLELFLRQSNVR